MQTIEDAFVISFDFVLISPGMILIETFILFQFLVSMTTFEIMPVYVCEYVCDLVYMCEGMFVKHTL